MSAILLDAGIVHYEVFGRGKPILLLHGWLGSWRYWMPTMESLSDTFRTYALDFWGFGDTDQPGDRYSIDDYVRQLSDFLDGLGISSISLVGHSLGGVVALRAALDFPQRVDKLVLVDTPIHGDSLAASVKLARNPFSRLVAGPRTMVGLWMRSLKKSSADWAQMYDEIVEDTTRLDENAVQESVEHMLTLDLRPDLQKLYTHTLVIHGEKDEFVSPDQTHLFNGETVATAQVVILQGCRHFPFLDEPSKFNRLLKEFLGSEIGTVVTVKEEWKRRYKETEFL
jgi:pimeloyl-ACP methyl ester carboxylesterase